MDNNEKYQYDLPDVDAIVDTRNAVNEVLTQHIEETKTMGPASLEAYNYSTKRVLEGLTGTEISTEHLGKTIWSAIKATGQAFRNGLRKISYAFSHTGLRELKDLEAQMAKLDGHKLKNEFVNEELAEMVSIDGEFVGEVLPDINRRVINQARAVANASRDQTIHLKSVMKLLNDSPAFISLNENEDIDMSRRELDATADEIHGLLIQCSRAAVKRGWWASEVEAFQQPLLADNQIFYPGAVDLLRTDMHRVHDSDSRRLSELLKKCPGKVNIQTRKKTRSNTTRVSVPELDELAAILKSSIELGRAIEDLYNGTDDSIDGGYLHQIFKSMAADTVYEMVDEDTGKVIGEFVTLELSKDDKVRATNLAAFYGSDLNDTQACVLTMGNHMLRQVRNNAAFVRACLKYYK